MGDNNIYNHQKKKDNRCFDKADAHLVYIFIVAVEEYQIKKPEQQKSFVKFRCLFFNKFFYKFPLQLIWNFATLYIVWIKSMLCGIAIA